MEATHLCFPKTHLVSWNESTYIPIGTTHSLENPGKETLMNRSGVWGRTDLKAEKADVADLRSVVGGRPDISGGTRNRRE